jgi:DNA-binding NarL/FixJ family response regulator
MPKSEIIEEPNVGASQTKIPLSARELEVLRLIASGLANREIAQRLFLTESTVELHASRIRKKLKLKSRTALVKFACDNHLV